MGWNRYLIGFVLILAMGVVTFACTQNKSKPPDHPLWTNYEINAGVFCHCLSRNRGLG